MPFYVMAHFGLWDRLSSFAEPSKSYPYLRASWAYANAIKALSEKNVKEADQFIQIFTEATQDNNRLSTTQQAFGNNLKLAKDILKARRASILNQTEKSISHWQSAVLNEVAGGDPAPWLFPVRQGLGFSFLRANKPLQARDTFLSDLAMHPNNPWSLHGLALAYQALGDSEQYQNTQYIFNDQWVGLSLPSNTDID